MFFEDSSDLTFTSGPRLLSESPPPPASIASSHSQTGHGGDDLSLSELSLEDRLTPRRSNVDPDQSIYDEDDSGESEGRKPEDDEQAERQAAKAREEKLQRDLFILRKLNSSFAAYTEVLKDTKTATERVAEQLADTDALLNKYINILGKSEAVTRLIFDERWEGAEQDEDIIEREEKEAEEKARQEDAERVLAVQREKERLERVEREAREREERERLERERGARGGAKGVIRGVRGTRASMRGLRSASATGTRGVPSAMAKDVRPSGIPSARTSIATSRGITSTTRGVPHK